MQHKISKRNSDRFLPTLPLRVSVLALAAVFSSAAWAGNGGSGYTTSGNGSQDTAGVGGTNGGASSNGQDAQPGSARRGGGGGATNIETGFGGSGGMSTSGTAAGYVPPSSTGSAGAVGVSVVDQNIAGGDGAKSPGTIFGVNFAGGGGGGVGVTTTADLLVSSGFSVTGGNGGGATNTARGSDSGGGGGGGAGVFASANVTVQSGASVIGGNGGGNLSFAGGGGGGGVGLILSGVGTLANSGQITGGNGGRASTSITAGTTFVGGQGGSGGEGVWVSDGGTVVNDAGGQIAGGKGAAYTGPTLAMPVGGAGLVGANATVINAGTIQGGVSGMTGETGNAVEFIGGVNSLEVRAGSAITGNVLAFSAADTLKLGGATDSSFDVSAIGASAQYQGFGIYEKTGASTWTLTGSSTEATPWTIKQGTLALDSTVVLTNFSFAINNTGTLQVNGSNTSSAIAINSGGTLRGVGTVGATTVRSGGVIAPGNSIGTLNVNGAYVQEKGGVYQVEVDPTSSASDRIAVTGKATIEQGAILNVTRTTAAPYVLGTRYTVLTASDGVTGTFDVTGDSALTAFYGLASASDGSDSYLEVKQTKTITDIAASGNQQAVAEGLDSTGPGSAAATPVLNQQTADDARMALNQLSGEVYASVQSAMLESSRVTRDAMSDRLTDTLACSTTDAANVGNGAPNGQTGQSASGCGATRGWARFYGNWGHLDGDGNASRLDTSLSGVFIGADMPVLNDWRMGVLAGYSHGRYDMRGSNASAKSDDWHLGVYGGKQWGALGFRSGLSYTWHDIKADRNLAVPGFSDRMSSSYDAGTAQIFGELGYRFDLGRSSVEPFLNLAYVNQRADGFKESGGADALRVRSQDMDTAFSTLGLRGKTSFTVNGMDMVAKGTLGWRYAAGDVRPTVTQSFAGGSAFDISGAPIARNQAVVDLGVGARITRNTTVSLSYTGQFASSATDQGVLGSVNIAF